jgi:hypothetical protein
MSGSELPIRRMRTGDPFPALIRKGSRPLLNSAFDRAAGCCIPNPDSRAHLSIPDSRLRDAPTSPRRSASAPHHAASAPHAAAPSSSYGGPRGGAQACAQAGNAAGLRPAVRLLRIGARPGIGDPRSRPAVGARGVAHAGERGCRVRPVQPAEGRSPAPRVLRALSERGAQLSVVRPNRASRTQAERAARRQPGDGGLAGRTRERSGDHPPASTVATPTSTRIASHPAVPATSSRATIGICARAVRSAANAAASVGISANAR